MFLLFVREFFDCTNNIFIFDRNVYKENYKNHLSRKIDVQR